MFCFVIIAVAISFAEASAPANVSSPYYYSFNTAGVLHETGNMDASSSPYWWLNSGAKLSISDGTGKTVQSELPPNYFWRLTYLNSNPLDTDEGYHPQNIFRLLTRSRWGNSQESAYFKIIRDQLSSSSNRAAHNGLLLMSRYQNSNNLYYVGIRVDGKAIIKKKLNGNYYTLAYSQVFPGNYNRESNPNLLPKNLWIGLRSRVVNNADGSVSIKLYMDQNRTGNWVLVLETTDINSPILNEGYGGIRTDFMDVEFDDFREVNV